MHFLKLVDFLVRKLIGYHGYHAILVVKEVKLFGVSRCHSLNHSAGIDFSHIQGFTFDKCRRAINRSPQFAWRVIHSP